MRTETSSLFDPAVDGSVSTQELFPVEALQLYLAHLTESTAQILSSMNQTLDCYDDFLGFGYFWHQICSSFSSKEELYSQIKERKEALLSQKEHFKTVIEDRKKEDPLFYQEVGEILTRATLVPALRGQGGAYLAIQGPLPPFFLVKPVDESFCCLNNHNLHGSPLLFDWLKPRPDIRFYQSSQVEAMSYDAAVLLGLAHITPKTILMLVESSHFHDLSDQIPDEGKRDFEKRTGPISKEKLCSIQEYICNAQSLQDKIQSWQAEGYVEEKIFTSVDPQDFENMNILLWTTYDNDAHLDNFLIYEKEHDSGSSIWGLQKIDNSLSFPEKNTGFSNALAFLPNAALPLSLEAKQKLQNFPLEDMQRQMERLELHASIEALQERVETLQALAARDLSIYEMNLRMMALSLPQGKDLALSSCSIEHLEMLLSTHDAPILQKK